ncbi:hypothetical protein [Streptomyces sp. B1I3]|uniref:hypothetical protein n=1 Tax=Streptomyces sp. B1I3 TaxID=3042264 RepID=UPI0027879167|nr:hypothetical protein [Streptomyces sp. B1I3]MDQ0792026.1 hypothetical protein [Streptomyces sp. B1I3]
MSRTKAPTIAQLHNLADRADRGPLRPEEVSRLRAGIDRFAVTRKGVGTAWGNRVRALQRRLEAIHRPVQRGSMAVCSECSGWNGVRCLGLVTPWPCPTLEAVDTVFPIKEAAA